MKKQIFAIVLCTVLILTTFAACGKKHLMITDQEGNTFLAVTDEEGRTILNEVGNIEIYNTEKNGDIVTNADGEMQINAITFPEHVAKGSNYETIDFVWELPKDWLIENNTIQKPDSSLKVIVSLLPDENFDKMLSDYQQNLKNQDPALLEKLQLVTSEDLGIPGVAHVFKVSSVLNSDTENALYVQNYFLKINEKSYQITVTCDAAEKETADFDNMFTFFHVR